MIEVKERPILFSAPMVRAILDGRKTVTRRAVKVQPEVRMVDMIGPMLTFKNKRGGHWLYPNAKQQIIADCPYGTPGERLWVRETFMDLIGTGVEHRPTPDSPLQRYAYAADCPAGSHADEARKDYGLKWKPSIHMPRAACRILLEITDVRVERLQDISDEQAIAEGIEPFTDFQSSGHWRRYRDGGTNSYVDNQVMSYASLWSEINGAGSWEANPWVWVVEFKRVQP
jgi:hypothetical protein